MSILLYWVCVLTLWAKKAWRCWGGKKQIKKNGLVILECFLNKKQNRADSSSSQKHSLGWCTYIVALFWFVQTGRTNNSAQLNSPILSARIIPVSFVLLSEGWISAWAMQIWTAYAITKNHSVFWVWVSVKGHVLVHKLPQLWSVLMSMAIAPTKSREDGASQSWSCPSLATALGRTVPVLHQLYYSWEWALYLPRAIQYRSPCSMGCGCAGPENYRIRELDPMVCHTVLWVRERYPACPSLPTVPGKSWSLNHERGRADPALL